MPPESPLDPAQEQYSPRLNILALPSRTTLLFALILIVIYVPLFAALGGITPVCAPFMLLVMFLIPLHLFLSQPERIRRTKQLDPEGSRYTALASTIEQQAVEKKVAPPALQIGPPEGDSAFTFGTWRRQYIAFAAPVAELLDGSLRKMTQARERTQAVVLHELAHFRQNDVWMATLAQKVMRVAFVFFTLNMLLSFLVPWFYYAFVRFYNIREMYPDSVLLPLVGGDPKILEALSPNYKFDPTIWVLYEMFIFVGHWPLILGSLLLLVFFWRALLRTRELYADAQVVQWQRGDPQSLWGALAIMGMLSTIGAPLHGWKQKRNAWKSRVWYANVWGWQTLRDWLEMHPSDAKRRACIQAPEQVYGGNGSIGLTAGAAVVLLNLTLSSLFLSQYTRGPNSGPPFLIGFAVIALSLLPTVCVLSGAVSKLLPRIFKIVVLFTVIKLIPQLLLSATVFAAVNDRALLELAAGTLGGVILPQGTLNEFSDQFIVESFVLRPAILYTFFMPVFLTGYVFFVLAIQRRVLSWYGAEFMARHSRHVFMYVTGVFTLVLALVILPIVDLVTVPSAHLPVQPLTLIGMGIVTLFALGNVLWFIRLDRRYARRCPHCQARVEPEYQLGLRCTECNELLNAWLLMPLIKAAVAYRQRK